MSWKPDKNMRTIAVTAFLVVAASMLFYFFLFRTTTLGFGLSKVFSVLNPIIYGFVIAYILNPQMIVYEKIVCRIWTIYAHAFVVHFCDCRFQYVFLFST